MSTDSGSPIPQRPGGTPTLPGILRLKIRLIHYNVPKLRYFKSPPARLRQAIEFKLETDGPIPARAYGPALFVGEFEINHSERLNDTTWRLLSFAPKKLKPGAPIYWGWMKDPPALRQPTEFRYALDDGK